MTYIIRPLTLEDFDVLTELLEEIQAYHAEGDPHIFKYAEAPVFEYERVEEILSYPDDNLALIVVTPERAIGFLYAYMQDRPATHIQRARRVLVVGTIGITEVWRSRGIGKGLMKSAEMWGLERGAQDVVLSVWQFNEPAIKFYEKLGYATEQVRMRKVIDKD